MPPLADADVHVWGLDLDDVERALLQPIALLSEDERARADRFRFERDRDRYVSRRAQLRRLLAGYLDADPASLRFRYGPHGRPELVNSELRWNLSHTGGYALLAVTRSRAVGVDIESVRALDDMEALAASILSPAEHAVFARLAPAQRTAALYAAWTRKEALVKATGLGLSIAPSRVEVEFAPGREPRLLRFDGPQGALDWSLRDLAVAAGYAAALAVVGRVRNIIRLGEP